MYPEVGEEAKSEETLHCKKLQRTEEQMVSTELGYLACSLVNQTNKGSPGTVVSPPDLYIGGV